MSGLMHLEFVDCHFVHETDIFVIFIYLFWNVVFPEINFAVLWIDLVKVQHVLGDFDKFDFFLGAPCCSCTEECKAFLGEFDLFIVEADELPFICP